MADITFNNEYCSVTDIVTGEIIIAEKLTGRVETGHILNKYTDIESIPLAKLPVLKEGEIQEVNKLYVVSGKIICNDEKPIIDIIPIKDVIIDGTITKG